MFIKLTDALESDLAEISDASAIMKLIKEERYSEIPVLPQGFVYIDANKITSMRKIEADIQYPMGSTIIRCSSKLSAEVQETPEEILDMIFDVKESKRVAKRMLKEEYRRRRQAEEHENGKA